MPTSTKTRIELANSILLSCGERPLSSSGGTLGSLVNDCIKEALLEVCTSSSWNELRTNLLGTWSGDTATLDTEVYRVQGVNWYSSPTGSAAATYDYPIYPIEFVTLDEYLHYPLTPYTNSAQNRPRFWTMQGVNTIRVNPYPNDSTERDKVSFDVFKLVAFPNTDNNTFSCSDQLLNLVQYKASALFGLKFLSDMNQFQAFDAQYESLRRKMLVSDSALPSGGYTIFRGRRR